MKKVVLSLLCGMLVLALCTADARAVPAIKKQFDQTYVESSQNEDFKAAAKKAKCNVCHYGKSKKNRNDYGMALSQFLKKDDYKTSRVKAEPEKVKEEIETAFKKVEDMKSVSGKKFGELLKVGQLPGTEPTETE